MAKRKFFIAGGGTGGHIYPGVAIARAMETLDSSLVVEFVGSNSGLETKIVPREGFALHILASGKLNYRGSIIIKFFNLFKVAWGFFQALALLTKEKPIGVLGVGGYASGPLVLAAHIMGIPSAIWEPNAHPGLTNRWLSRWVPRSFIVFDEAKKYLKSPQIHLMGLPVRRELENLASKTKSDKENSDEFHVLSFGGSQGAQAINKVLTECVKSESQWLYKAKLIHQTGVSDYTDVNEIYLKSVFDVKAFEYLFEMDKYYQWADLVIARSGASTIAELAATGKPAILVPLPTSADDHQRKNALALLEKNAALLIEQKDFTKEKLNQVLLDLKQNDEKLKVLSQNIKLLHHPLAAESIAKVLLENK